jgi:copper chaperone
VRQFTIHVRDMTCRHCVRSVSQAVADVGGVREVVADLGTRAVQVHGEVDPEVICAAMAAIGYHARVIEHSPHHRQT